MLIYSLTLIRRRCRLVTITIFLVFFVYLFGHRFTTKHGAHMERLGHLLLLAENRSLCSERSARRGFNQHVLSVSAYESNDRIQLRTNLTWSYIETFVAEAKKFYPSWVVRVYYYNLIGKTKADITNLEKAYDNLDFCDVENLPVLGNLRDKLPGKVQRFLPAVDPLVGVTMVRDLDSEIFEREVQAVNEWLTKTTYAFHIMRDHYMHNIPMLGGLWGVATNRLSINDRLVIASALLPSDKRTEIDEFLKTYSKAGDQLFLEHHIWPLARHNSLAHDSFSCFWSRYIYGTDTRPFLSKRHHPTCFVGCPKPCCTNETKTIADLTSYTQCPRMCRPPEHQEWLFC